MKKIILAFFLIFILCNLSIARMSHKGDDLGSHKAEKNVDLNSFSITNPDKVDGVDVSQLQIDTTTLADRLDNLPGTSQRYYLNPTASSFDYEYYGTSTSISSSQVTFTKTLNGTGIIVSSSAIYLEDITTIPAGMWEIEFYANINNSNTTRIYFEIWDGTGTAISEAQNHITTTFLSSPLSQDIEEYFVALTTITYVPKTRYLSVIMKANEAGTNPTLSYYRGGIYDSHLLMPVLRAEVSVTKNIAGTNITIFPTNGLGEVTINADLSSKLNASSGTTIAGLINERLLASSGTVIDAGLNSRLDASSGTTITGLFTDVGITAGSLRSDLTALAVSTGVPLSINLIFVDTTSATFFIPRTIKFTGIYLRADIADTFNVKVATCSLPDGVFQDISPAEDLTANTSHYSACAGWTTTDFIAPNGAWLKVYPNDTWTSGRPITVAIKY